VIHLELLLLIIVANGVPVIAYDLFHSRFIMPLDFGFRLVDGQPLFGESKTWRGILLSVPVTATMALLLGMTWQSGALVAAAAMSGDLLSSFIKRRIRMTSGSFAPGIDQVPEALIPLLVMRESFGLSGEVVFATLVAFIVLEMFLSRVLFRLHLRKRPY